jgi:hypothetical protein
MSYFTPLGHSEGSMAIWKVWGVREVCMYTRCLDIETRGLDEQLLNVYPFMMQALCLDDGVIPQAAEVA